MQTGIAFLESLGLEMIEAQVYESALSLGTVPASIIANRLKIPRSSARYTCERLIKKGLMLGSIQNNTKIYTAENPTVLYSLVMEQENMLIKKREQLNSIVKDFQKIYNPYTILPKVTFYEGIDGIDRLLEEMLEHPTDMVSFGAGDYLREKYPELITNFRKNAGKQYKTIKVMRSEKYRQLHTNDPMKMQTKYFRILEELKVDIQIVDDKVSISSVENNAPMGVLIKHAEIAHAFSEIFAELWSALARIEQLEKKGSLE